MTTSNTRSAAAPARPFLRSPRRVALAALGLVCVGIGLIGVFVPGLPTTIFLIAASYLFTRSCPVLEKRLLGARIFRPYVKYMDRDVPLPRALRIKAMAAMWTAVALSLSLLAVTNQLSTWCAVGMIAAAFVGMIAIARVRRGPVPPGGEATPRGQAAPGG